MTRPDTITLTLDRSLIEHPYGLHLRRMRTALWLYLALLARIPQGATTTEVHVIDLAAGLGLKEGTVRSWLGHLRRSGYIRLRRLNGSVIVTVPGLEGSREEWRPHAEHDASADHEFTVSRIQRALGETGNDETVAGALAQHDASTIQRALAGALAPPASEIRRSRTALFLFLLKRYDNSPNHYPRS
jgi:hypothetical protein